MTETDLHRPAAPYSAPSIQGPAEALPACTAESPAASTADRLPEASGRHTPAAPARQARTARRVATAAAVALPRLVAGTVLITGAVLAVERQGDIRSIEARAFAAWVNQAGPAFAPARPVTSMVFVRSGPTSLIGLDITPECTSAFLIAPLLLLAGAMALFARRHCALRITTAALGAGLVLFAANQLRIAMIAESIRRWGTSEGYPIAHRVLGSLLLLTVAATAHVLHRAVSRRPASATP